jgi:hypothetical protein
MCPLGDALGDVHKIIRIPPSPMGFTRPLFMSSNPQNWGGNLRMSERGPDRLAWALEEAQP